MKTVYAPDTLAAYVDSALAIAAGQPVTLYAVAVAALIWAAAWAADLI